jgi:hypothetical protein
MVIKMQELMTETKPKLKLSLKPRTLGLNLADKPNVDVETKSETKNSPTPPKADKAPKVQIKKKLREHRIIEPEIYTKILKHFRVKYPNCFCKPAKPLAIGIFKEAVSESEEINVSRMQLRHFFRAYCKNRAYRELIVVGAERFGLNGEVTSLVTEEEVLPNRVKPSLA